MSPSFCALLITSTLHLMGRHQFDSYISSESSSPIRAASSARTIPVRANSFMLGNLGGQEEEEKE